MRKLDMSKMTEEQRRGWEVARATQEKVWEMERRERRINTCKMNFLAFVVGFFAAIKCPELASALILLFGGNDK